MAGARGPTPADVRAMLRLSHALHTSSDGAARKKQLLSGWVYHADLLMASHGAAALSPRQKETLRHLRDGCSEKQIADKLHLSPNTVHHHIKALHRHFGVSSRSELLARWLR